MRARFVVGAVLAAGAVAGGAAGQAAVGVKAGVNLAELSGAVTAGSVTGLVVGGYLGFGVGDRVAVQLEGAYSVRGGRDVRLGANALDPAADPSEIRLAYIEIPVLLRTGYPGERLLPSLFIGPYAGWLIECQLIDDAGQAGDCDDATRPAWFKPRAHDYGIMAGGGLDLALGDGSVFIDVRYAIGLRSIQAGGDPADLRNGGLVITGGFAFPIGR